MIHESGDKAKRRRDDVTIDGEKVSANEGAMSKKDLEDNCEDIRGVRET